jgi:protein gp37
LQTPSAGEFGDEPVPSFERARIPNLWLGTTVGLQKWVKPRIPRLINTNATVRFLSIEPLLGPMTT